MKFVKENLTLVICGAVVLLSIVAGYLFWGPWREPLKQEMTTRWNEKETITAITNTDLKLPSITTQKAPGVTTQKGPPSQAYVDAKNEAIQKINVLKDEVQNAIKAANQQGRIANGIPILPVLSEDQRWGKPMPNLLPKRSQDTDPMIFKTAYGTQFPLWTSFLATGTIKEMAPEDTIPPRPERIQKEYDDAARRRVANAPPVAMGGGGGLTSSIDPKLKDQIARQLVLNTASDLRMYVEPNAFQIRSWRFSEDPPTDQQVFEALVDSWFQSDVVKAIAAVNIQGIGDATKKDIARAPVKRLIRVMVGSSAKTRVQGNMLTLSTTAEPGQLFYTSNVATAAPGAAPTMGPPVNPGAGAQATGPVAAPNTINYDLGMTGRSCGGEYDVVMMSVWVDIDPAYINQLVDALYKQNMGYTMVNIQSRTVNPLDRVSNGYLYGESQVVEAQIQFEGILFRGWTQPLMPDSLKVALGIPITPAAQ